MGKGNNKNSSAAKPATTPKPAAKVADKKAETKAEEVIVPEVVDEKTPEVKNPGLVRVGLGGHNSNKMSAGDKVKLAYLMYERWERNPEETIAKHGNDFFIEVQSNIDVMTILALADARQECLDAGIPLIAKGSGKSLLALNAACEAFGIQLPKEKTKLLENNPDTQLEINFTEATVLPATDEAIKADKTSREEYVLQMPELDPVKIKSSEELEKALRYHLTKQGANTALNIVNAINFMKQYRDVDATTEDKAVYAVRMAGDWVEDILVVAKPSLILSGIVRTVSGLLGKHGNVIMAHATLASQLKGQSAVCPVSDEDIASLLRTFVKVSHKYALPSVGADGKEVKEDLLESRAVKAIYNGSEEVLDVIIGLTEPDHKAAYYKTISTFFGIDSKSISKFGNTNFKELARMKMGQIMNLYLPLESKLSTYPGLPSDITEFPEQTVKDSDFAKEAAAEEAKAEEAKTEKKK